MTIQQSRRSNPYPWTWEIPTGIVLAVLLVMSLVTHVARSSANFISGGDWDFTARGDLFTSIPGILGGDATAGLTGPPANYASGQTLAIWIALTELATLAAVVWLLVWGMRRWGPGRVQGMASPGDAEQLLGLSRLRRNAHLIRPDLYPKDGR